MKAHKHNIRFRSVFILILFAWITGSCEVDNLQNDGETASELTGTWSCAEESEIYKSTNMVTTYEITIAANPNDEAGVLISNFYNVNITVEATISGNSLIIPNQTTDDDYIIYGYGTISGNRHTLNLNYVIDDNSGGAADHATAVCTKL
jgi:hypothetical protein